MKIKYKVSRDTHYPIEDCPFQVDWITEKNKKIGAMECRMCLYYNGTNPHEKHTVYCSNKGWKKVLLEEIEKL